MVLQLSCFGKYVVESDGASDLCSSFKHALNGSKSRPPWGGHNITRSHPPFLP